jgi:hypothetical protein
MQAIQSNQLIKEQAITAEPVRKTVALQPVAQVLPSVSPIHDLLASTSALERGNRIYWAMYLAVLAILVASVAVGFGGYISVF